MASKTVSFNTTSFYDCQLESIAKWLSCNGEVWGVGPTAVFASAAALFLYHELETSLVISGDHPHVSSMEKTLISTMVVGMLALMVHIWVCSMRFFQYYLDTLIRDSPNVLLEMTTAGILGQDMMPLGPLTKFLRQQQPQIHITVCWFLSLCYADYVRKHYCQRFNMPYLEQWQAEMHERASRGVRNTMEKATSFVEALQLRLRGFTQSASNRQRQSSRDSQTARWGKRTLRHATSALSIRQPWSKEGVAPPWWTNDQPPARSPCVSSARPATLPCMPSKSCALMSKLQGALALQAINKKTPRRRLT